MGQLHATRRNSIANGKCHAVDRREMSNVMLQTVELRQRGWNAQLKLDEKAFLVTDSGIIELSRPHTHVVRKISVKCERVK